MISNFATACTIKTTTYARYGGIDDLMMTAVEYQMRMNISLNF